MGALEIAVYGRILLGSGIVLAACWLAISFMAPGRARTSLEWLATVAMYLAIGSIMARLLHRFWIADNEALIGAFGFLCFVFGSGLVVSCVFLMRALAGRSAGAGAGAVH